MKVAYALPPECQSSQAILDALAERRCFPLDWLTALKYWEARIQTHRWHRSLATLPAGVGLKEDEIFLSAPERKEPLRRRQRFLSFGADTMCRSVCVDEAVADHKALQSLSQTRTQQLEELQAQLAQHRAGFAAKK